MARETDVEATPAVGSLKSAFRHRGFAPFLGATVISVVGDFLNSVGLLVVIYRETSSASWLGIAAFVRVGAWAAATATGGVIGDRYDRRIVLFVLNLLAGVVTLGLTVAAAAHAPVAVVVGAATAMSFVTGLVNPSFAAAVPALVGVDDIAAANAAVTTVEQVSTVAGPALGAVLVAAFSPELAFGVNALSFVVAGVIFWFVPCGGNVVTDADGHAEPVRFRDGVTAVRSSKSAKVLLGLFVGAVFSYGFGLVLIFLVAVDGLGLRSADVGYLRMAEGLGGVAAAVIAGRMASRSSATPLLIAGAVTAATPVLLAVIHSPALALAVLAVGGGALVVVEVIVVSWLQRVVPDDMLGRVMGLLMALGGIGTAVGSLLASVLDETLGLTWALIVSGLALAVPLVLTAPSLPAIARAAEQRRGELEPYTSVLRRLGLFSMSDELALEQIAASVESVELGPGKVVMREGDEADDLYIVRRGVLDVRASGEIADTPTFVNVMGPDDWFGEVGLLQGSPRTATVTTTTATELWRIPGSTFLAAYESLPAMPDTVGLGIAVRLQQTHPSRVSG